MMTTRTTHTAYTDGAASGNPGPAGWAVLLDGEKLFSGAVKYATNNQMELFAVKEAVELLSNCHLEIVTDSKLVIGWLSKGWRRNNPHIAELVDIIRDAQEARGVSLSFIKTKGHAYDPLNNRVDKAARCRSAQAKAER